MTIKPSMAFTTEAAGQGTPDRPPRIEQLTDEALQEYLLAGVSRTFALTIPLLPESLRSAVSNAYLLCRTIDTIEDDPDLDYEDKRLLCEQYVEVVEGKRDPIAYASLLLPLIRNSATAMEQELIAFTDRVVGLTQGLQRRARQAITRCIVIMSEGMIDFQQEQHRAGLPDLRELNRYCYVVAGVVGEMLTDLFCLQSSATNRNYQKMMSLSTSFGQGLQMVNILKDQWDDYRRGACWLPRDIFQQEQFDLQELQPGAANKRFDAGLHRLIGVAHAHLRNAFQYTLHVVPQDKGIRRFCLLALGLAMLTLQKINRNRHFTRAEEVKISRKAVKYTYIVTKLGASSDRFLQLLFRRASRGLPLADTSSARLQ